MNNHSNIAIIGCGPAGAVAGTLLAAKGYSVVIFDRDRHPRHHIGESLLPASLGILESIGMNADYLKAHHQGKYGARFVDPLTNRMETFGFASPQDGAPPPSFNVVRDQFDHQLRDIAEQKGCVIHENCAITRVLEEGSPVRLKTASGTEYTCDFLIDASGDSAVLAKKSGSREMLPDFGRLAIYNYFTNIEPAGPEDPLECHYLTMHLIDGGWIWFIPLRNGSTSIGIVLKREAVRKNLNPQQQFFSAIAQSPRLYQRLQKAPALASYYVAGDYSYQCSRKYGAHHILIGDAAGFLDPIFSSGVHLAITSADRAARAVDTVLRCGDSSALPEYQTEMDAGLRVFQAFITRFYQRDLVRNLFFTANKNPVMREAIIHILAGHVWDKSNPLISMLHVHNPVNADKTDAAIAECGKKAVGVSGGK